MGSDGRTDDARRVSQWATRLPEVAGKSSYGTPAFYVAGRISARLHEEPGVLVCWWPDPEDKEILLRSDPGTFFTTDHYHGHVGVLVRLDRVDDAELAELLAGAWKSRAPKRLLS